ncbi:MAG: hypothetical protein ACHQ52_10940, partial [Candidatus Eisenbacteria bacterium]
MRARRPLLSRALPGVLLLLAIGGCAERDRANPFDPANGTTQGRPAGFVALARDGRVELSWQPQTATGLTGYQVWRRTANETTYHAISAVLRPTIGHYSDLGLLNGLDHFYRLYYLFDTGPGTGPAEDVATPGPQIPWVADGTDQALLEITADGRHVAVIHGGFLGPVAVAADSSTQRVWCSDPDASQVRVLDIPSGVTVTIPVSGTPGALAAVPGDSSAWVCAEDAGQVLHLGPDGRVIQALQGLALPIGVAVSGFDGSLWVCERDANRVLHRDVDLGDLGPVTVPEPSRVAINPSTGDVWVSSFTAAMVWKLSSTGATLAAVGGFAGPVGLAVDPVRGNVWVADPAADRVRVLDPGGGIRFTVGGLPGAR